MAGEEEKKTGDAQAAPETNTQTVPDEPEELTDLEAKYDVTAPTEVDMPAGAGKWPEEKSEGEGGDEEEPATEQDEGEEVDAALVAQAVQVGIPQELAQALAIAGELDAVVKAWPQPKAEGQKTEAAPEKATPEVEGGYKPKLSRDVVDDDFVNEFENISTHINSQTERIAKLEQFIALQQKDREIGWFDGHLSGLGVASENLLGKGTVESLDRTTDAFKNRAALWEHFQDLTATAVQKGRPVEKEKLLRMAYNGLFGDKLKQEARQEIAAKLDKSKGGFVARPTHREASPTETPEERGVKRIREKMAEKGLDGGDNSSHLADTLPSRFPAAATSTIRAKKRR